MQTELDIALHERFPEQLTTLFEPQHGLWSTEQDNMIETGHAHYRSMPVHSLYSDSRKPTAEMLRGFDLLLVELMMLERPNPLGGEVAEGALLEPEHASFVDCSEIPMRHGLTIGELARHCHAVLGIGCELHVTEPRTFRPHQTTLLILHELHRLYGDQFA